nr:glycine-rich protein DOT1-like [Aegilops tauschii subsp. strangulata]
MTPNSTRQAHPDPDGAQKGLDLGRRGSAASHRAAPQPSSHATATSPPGAAPPAKTSRHRIRRRPGCTTADAIARATAPCGEEKNGAAAAGITRARPEAYAGGGGRGLEEGDRWEGEGRGAPGRLARGGDTGVRGRRGGGGGAGARPPAAGGGGSGGGRRRRRGAGNPNGSGEGEGELG